MPDALLHIFASLSVAVTYQWLFKGDNALWWACAALVGADYFHGILVNMGVFPL